MVVAVRETRRDIPLLVHKVKFLLFNAFAREEAVSSQKQQVVGEGLINYLLTMFERRVLDMDLAPFASFVRTRVVIIVEAPREVRERRMQERGRVPRSTFGPEYETARRGIEEHNYNVIKQFLCNTTKAEIIQNP